MYLSVNDKIPSKGYGTAIINRIKDDYKNKTIFLNVEPLDLKADNYDQRVSRINFYYKNEFKFTNHYILDNNDRYLILSFDNEIPLKDYKKVLKKLSFGLYTPKIETA